MKKLKELLAAITITWVLVFSCRVVMLPTPLAITEQIALVLMMVEYSFYKTKQLGVKDEEKRDV